jgi:predicted AAA+ superfamily ATPase
MKNEGIFMKRLLFNKLQEWQKKPDRKPLILLGARQVGKTFLLKQFGETCFKKVLYINFELEPKVHLLFQDSLNPKTLITQLEIYYNTSIDKKSTLIIFDEVQESPEALISLKYFCEQAPEYFIVAAGSLLGLTVKRSKGFPVGKVNFLYLYPLTYFEYLYAIGEDKLADYLSSIKTIDPLSPPLHELALNHFKTYMYIGGMPDAVKKYAESRQLLHIREIHHEIIKAYEFDFSKHAPPELVNRITEVWHSLPRQLGKENKKFIFSAVRDGARAREYDAAISWLLDAKLIYRANEITSPKLPLPAYSENNIFKIYLNDVGLLGAMANIESSMILHGNDLFTEFKGALTENFVADHLAMKEDKNKLYYWSSSNTAEVDFIVQFAGQVYPLEVKSGQSTKKKSLKVYEERYHPTQLHRVSPMNLRCDGNIYNYPLYLMERYPIIKDQEISIV